VEVDAKRSSEDQERPRNHEREDKKHLQRQRQHGKINSEPHGRLTQPQNLTVNQSSEVNLFQMPKLLQDHIIDPEQNQLNQVRNKRI
jgi:hypothetical protein